MDLILASASPARLKLLKASGIKVAGVHPAELDESRHKGEDPRSYALRLSLAKAQTVARHFPKSAVLAGDTVVAWGKKIMQKTDDIEEARAILTMLSGRKHQVITAITLATPTDSVDRPKLASRVSISKIRIKRLDPKEISDYLRGGEWRGKSGCFSLQGQAAMLIKSCEGSPSGVVGLPMYETYHLLRGAGLAPNLAEPCA